MDLTKIMTIAGKPGLYQLYSQTKNGIVVESLIDGRKLPVFANDRVSSLQDISIFTTGEDMPLEDVLKALFTKLNGEKALDPKSDKKELITFMDDNLPEWDRERVYPSDLKKLVTWYNMLIEHKLIDLKDKDESEEGEGKEEPKIDENES
ncbi:MAG: DUF5606 domain-containing protein [Bacteroidales bacterium]|nr:DUF5606 domain-containing protein [Bacteroidales bacterium]